MILPGRCISTNLQTWEKIIIVRVTELSFHRDTLVWLVIIWMNCLNALGDNVSITWLDDLFRKNQPQFCPPTSFHPLWCILYHLCWKLENTPDYEPRAREKSSYTNLVASLWIQIMTSVFNYAVKVLKKIDYLDNLKGYKQKSIHKKKSNCFKKVTSRSRLPESSCILLMMSDTSMSVGFWPHLRMAACNKNKICIYTVSRKNYPRGCSQTKGNFFWDTV